MQPEEVADKAKDCTEIHLIQKELENSQWQFVIEIVNKDRTITEIYRGEPTTSGVVADAQLNMRIAIRKAGYKGSAYNYTDRPSPGADGRRWRYISP
jgi:hypothetical protein